MPSRTLSLALLFVTASHSAAQFPFFDNMFGHQQQQQQQQQQYRSGAPHRSSQVDSVSCAQYLCPVTLDCVPLPADCPCPDEQDIKCVVPDMDGDVDEATVVCVRGQNECAQVERLMRRGTAAGTSKGKGKKGSRTWT